MSRTDDASLQQQLVALRAALQVSTEVSTVSALDAPNEPTGPVYDEPIRHQPSPLNEMDERHSREELLRARTEVEQHRAALCGVRRSLQMATEAQQQGQARLQQLTQTRIEERAVSLQWQENGKRLQKEISRWYDDIREVEKVASTLRREAEQCHSVVATLKRRDEQRQAEVAALTTQLNRTQNALADVTQSRSQLEIDAAAASAWADSVRRESASHRPAMEQVIEELKRSRDGFSSWQTALNRTSDLLDRALASHDAISAESTLLAEAIVSARLANAETQSSHPLVPPHCHISSGDASAGAAITMALLTTSTSDVTSVERREMQESLALSARVASEATKAAAAACAKVASLEADLDSATHRCIAALAAAQEASSRRSQAEEVARRALSDLTRLADAHKETEAHAQKVEAMLQRSTAHGAVHPKRATAAADAKHPAEMKRRREPLSTLQPQGQAGGFSQACAACGRHGSLLSDGSMPLCASCRPE